MRVRKLYPPTVQKDIFTGEIKTGISELITEHCLVTCRRREFLRRRNRYIEIKSIFLRQNSWKQRALILCDDASTTSLCVFLSKTIRIYRTQKDSQRATNHERRPSHETTRPESKPSQPQTKPPRSKRSRLFSSETKM